MRILAIRGRNIASLGGDFDIDFRREPLASAGLFAICGPTGSGKSTLLDVLCLALYDNTPRLEKATGHGVNLPDVADHTLSPQDARNLLTRGAAEGCAEVDFAGNDGEEYRARWSVRRARGRVDGRLQPADLSLVRLSDNQRIGALKSEVLPEIESRLGLDFAQFTRAVLLAQNEFTAFLQADDNARAALLEQLTGTDIYTVLSQRAYARAQQEEQALEGLKDRVQTYQPLEAAERAAIEAQASEGKSAAASLQAVAQVLDQQLRWHEDFDRARRVEEEGRRALEKAARERDAAAERARHLARVESVQPARSLLAEYDRTAGDLRESREQAVPRAETEAGDAAEQLRKAEEAHAGAQEAVARAEANLRSAAPQLAKARELDLEVSALEEQHAASAAERDRIAVADDEARRALTAARAQREACVAEHHRTSEWLQQHADWRRLSEEWSRWDTLFRQAAAAESKCEAARSAVVDVEHQVLEQRERVDRATRGRQEAEAVVERARVAFEAADKTLAAFDIASIVSARTTALERRHGLSNAQQLEAARADLGTRRKALEESHAAEREKFESASGALREIEARRDPAEAMLQQAERAYDEVRQASARSVEKLREALEPGRPCPVCGATEHPYVTGQHAFNSETLGVLKRQLKECREQVEGLATQAAGHRAVAASASKRAEEIEHELQAVTAQLNDAERMWRDNGISTETAHLGDGTRPAWFAEQVRAVDERLRELDAGESAARNAAATCKSARSALDEARQQEQTEARLEQDAKADARQAEAKLTASRDALTRTEELRDALLRDLDALFPDSAWRTEWSAGTEAFRARHEQRAGEYRSRSESRRACDEQAALLDVQIQGLAKTADAAVADLHRATDACQRLEKHLGEKRQARCLLFEGRPAGDVQQELEGAVEVTRTCARGSERRLGEARARHSAAAARLDAATTLMDQRRHAAEASTRDLNGWLANYNATRAGDPVIDIGGLRDLVAFDAAWLAAERQELAEIERRFDAAGTVLHERRAHRETLETARPTDETVDVLRARRDEVTTSLDAARTRHIEAETRLGQDNERRIKGQELRVECERQAEVTTLWAQVSNLIGSADGKKFRNYAQQLTLDVLLDYANRHLAELARRYRLQRLAGTLALVVVDRDMADEVRSVYSLSGGESFLVSLALALGLASLSANRVRIESLFIDEGFGALDADTLSVAMDALERLHAQGRKVGVISHVQEMAERIGTQIRVERQSGGRSRVEVR